MYLILPFVLQILKYLPSDALSKGLPAPDQIYLLYQEWWKCRMLDQSFPLPSHFTVEKVKAQGIWVTLSRSHSQRVAAFRCREFLSFPTLDPSASLSENNPSLFCPQTHPRLTLTSSGPQAEKHRDCVIPEPKVSTLGVFRNLSSSLSTDVRENCAPDTDQHTLTHRYPHWATVRGSPDPSRKPPSGCSERVNCSAVYHVPGSPPGAILNRSQGCLGLDSDFPTDRLVLYPRQAAGWRGMGTGSYEGRKGPWSPKPLLLSGLSLKKNSPKWRLKVKMPLVPLGPEAPETEEEDDKPLMWPS